MPQDGSFELRQIAGVVRRWIWLIATCVLLSAAAAFFVQVRQPPAYEATATIMVEVAYDSLASQYNALVTGERLALTYSEMVRGSEVLESAIAASGVDISAAELDKLLKVEPVVNTQLIRLSVRHASPETAALLVNGVARQFAVHVRELQASRFDAYAADLRKQTEALAANRREIQSQLDAAGAESVRNEMELANMQNVLGELVQFSTAEGDPTERLVIANTLVQQLAPRPSPQPSELPVDESAPAADQLLTVPLLIDQVRTQIDRLSSEASFLRANRAELEFLLAESNDELRARQRDLEQIQLLVADGADTVVVTDPAREPAAPIRHEAVYVALAAIMGALIAFALALLYELLDDTLRTAQDAKDALELPALGAVGRLSQPARAKAGGNTEAYSMLAAKVRYAATGGALRTILVSSPGPEEGRTTTVANLAVAMAQTGLTVVAVDADLRHPRLHQHFGLEPGRGFSDSLREGRVDEFLQVTPYEGVRLLTCGSAVDRPAATLSPDRLPELFSALAQLADLVLVDSAPILDAADTTILAAEADGVLLVLRAGRTRGPAAVEATESLQHVRANLIGLVLNDAAADAAADSAGYLHRFEGAHLDASVSEAGTSWAGKGSISGHIAANPETR